MLVNENVIEQLCMDAGHARTQKARRYQMLGNVSITKVEYENENNFENIKICYNSIFVIVYLF